MLVVFFTVFCLNMNNVVHEPVMVQEICNAIPDNSRFIFD